jgi:Heparinase II/III-like protein/Heparinase II/III N-terminus
VRTISKETSKLSDAYRDRRPPAVMRLRTLHRALRKMPLTTLAREAGWRGIRFIRKCSFGFANNHSSRKVCFYPIGYYRRRTELLSEAARAAIVSYAEAVLRGEFPLMGYGSPKLGDKPDWHCDWVSGQRWPLQKAGQIKVVRHDGSDVKAPWELSRLQFAPVVAKAFVLTGDERYRKKLQSLLTDWLVHNPVGMGVNWTIAMEAALRGISLCLTMELLWPFTDEEQPWLDQMTKSLWWHLRFVESHSEFSFLPRSNHYLSNIVGLTTMSAYLQGQGMSRRVKKYARSVQRETLSQTYPDGGDYEASTGYHVLVAQMLLHSSAVQRQCGLPPDRDLESRLALMFEWITALADDAYKLPLLGDCDNGRVELLFDDIAQATKSAGERHSLCVGSLCGAASHLLQLPLGGNEEDAAWFGFSTASGIKQIKPKSVVLMADSGIAVLRAGRASAIFSAMPNGLRGRGSHTHCDKLSVVLRLGHDEVFSDSGSQGYTRSAQLRNLDRSTRAHTTLMVDEAEQNTLGLDPGSIFECGNEAAVSRISILDRSRLTARASHHGYARLGIQHRRTIELDQFSLQIEDEVTGEGEHEMDLRYVLGPEWTVSEIMCGETAGCVIVGPQRLTLQCRAEGKLMLSVLPARISREYAASLPASCIQIHTTARLPVTLQTRVQWD